MDQDWPDWLRPFVRNGQIAEAGVREAKQRIDGGRIDARDLYRLILAPFRALDDSNLRRLAMVLVKSRQNLAPSVLNCYSQTARVPAPAVEVTQARLGHQPIFHARAALDCGGRRFEGKPVDRQTKRLATHAALVSLLEELANDCAQRARGESRPVLLTPNLVEPTVPDAMREILCKSSELAMLGEAAFSALLLKTAAHSDPPEALIWHAEIRARSGLLSAQQLAIVLFQAQGSAWDGVRREGLLAAMRLKSRIADLMNQYAALRGIETARYSVPPNKNAEGLFEAYAHIMDTNRTVIGPAAAPSKAGARDRVRLMALSHFARIAPPEAGDRNQGHDWLVVTDEQTPLDVVNTALKDEVLTHLSWTPGFDGTFKLCIATCRWCGIEISARGRHAVWDGAQQEAAAAVMAIINSRVAAYRATPAEPSTIEALGASPAPEEPSDLTSMAGGIGEDVTQPEWGDATGAAERVGATSEAAEIPAARPSVVRPKVARAAVDAEQIAAVVDLGGDLVFDMAADPVEAGLLCVIAGFAELGSR